MTVQTPKLNNQGWLEDISNEMLQSETKKCAIFNTEHEILRNFLYRPST